MGKMHEIKFKMKLKIVYGKNYNELVLNVAWIYVHLIPDSVRVTLESASIFIIFQRRDVNVV